MTWQLLEGCWQFRVRLRREVEEAGNGEVVSMWTGVLGEGKVAKEARRMRRGYRERILTSRVFNGWAERSL